MCCQDSEAFKARGFHLGEASKDDIPPRLSNSGIWKVQEVGNEKASYPFTRDRSIKPLGSSATSMSDFGAYFRLTHVRRCRVSDIRSVLYPNA